MKKWLIRYAWQLNDIEPEEPTNIGTEFADTLQKALEKFMVTVEECKDKVVIFSIEHRK